MSNADSYLEFGEGAVTTFTIPNYEAYRAFQKSDGAAQLRLSMPGATLVIENGFDPHEIYRNLQSVFCELMYLENRLFME